MKLFNRAIIAVATVGTVISGSALAEVTEASSEKHAKAATQYRQAVFQSQIIYYVEII